CQMNDAEIMTTAFIASLFFRGNHESARAMLKQHGYIPHMVSKSRFSRRLHRIKAIFIVLFDLLAQTWKTLNTEAIYVIDSIPIAVCSNSSPPILIVTMIPFGCMALCSKGRCPFPDVYRVIAQQVGVFPLFFPCLSSLHL